MLPASRHLRLGLNAALRNPGLTVLAAAADLLASLTATLPVIVGLILLVRYAVLVLAASLSTPEPLAFIGGALSDYLTSREFLLPVLGLAGAGLLLSGVFRVFSLTGTVGVLGEDVVAGRHVPRGTFMEQVGRRFHAAFGLAVLGLAAALAWNGWTLGTVWSGAVLLVPATQAGAGVAAAAALAFALSIAVVGGLFADVVSRIAVVRVVSLGEGPAVGLYEAVRFVLRRPMPVVKLALLSAAVYVGIGLLFGMATGVTGLVGPEAMTSGYGLAASWTGTLIEVLGTAFALVLVQGAFAALVLDDAGRFPEIRVARVVPRPPPPEEGAAPDEPAQGGRPDEQSGQPDGQGEQQGGQPDEQGGQPGEQSARPGDPAGAGSVHRAERVHLARIVGPPAPPPPEGEGEPGRVVPLQPGAASGTPEAGAASGTPEAGPASGTPEAGAESESPGDPEDDPAR